MLPQEARVVLMPLVVVVLPGLPAHHQPRELLARLGVLSSAEQGEAEAGLRSEPTQPGPWVGPVEPAEGEEVVEDRVQIMARVVLVVTVAAARSGSIHGSRR